MNKNKPSADRSFHNITKLAIPVTIIYGIVQVVFSVIDRTSIKSALVKAFLSIVVILILFFLSKDNTPNDI